MGVERVRWFMAPERIQENLTSTKVGPGGHANGHRSLGYNPQTDVYLFCVGFWLAIGAAFCWSVSRKRVLPAGQTLVWSQTYSFIPFSAFLSAGTIGIAQILLTYKVYRSKHITIHGCCCPHRRLVFSERAKQTLGRNARPFSHMRTCRDHCVLCNRVPCNLRPWSWGTDPLSSRKGTQRGVSDGWLCSCRVTNRPSTSQAVRNTEDGFRHQAYHNIYGVKHCDNKYGHKKWKNPLFLTLFTSSRHFNLLAHGRNLLPKQLRLHHARYHDLQM